MLVELRLSVLLKDPVKKTTINQLFPKHSGSRFADSECPVFSQLNGQRFKPHFSSRRDAGGLIWMKQTGDNHRNSWL